MKDWKSQAHVKWECKYHVVILPKYRKKVLYGKVRLRIGGILRNLCRFRKALEDWNWGLYLGTFFSFTVSRWHPTSTNVLIKIMTPSRAVF